MIVVTLDGEKKLVHNGFIRSFGADATATATNLFVMDGLVSQYSLSTNTEEEINRVFDLLVETLSKKGYVDAIDIDLNMVGS